MNSFSSPLPYMSPCDEWSSLEDNELYSLNSDPIPLNLHNTRLHLQVSLIENHIKAHSLPPYAMLSGEPMSPGAGDVGHLPVTEKGLHLTLTSLYRDSSPWSASGTESPRINYVYTAFPMSPPYDDAMISQEYEDYAPLAAPSYHSVALQQVQSYPDPQPIVHIEPEQTYHNGMDQHDDAVPSVDISDPPFSEGTTDHKPISPSPQFRAKSHRSKVGSLPKARIEKPSSKNKKSTRERLPSGKKDKASKRKFVCVFSRYGCSSTFGSKNEWKRHVKSQHIQTNFYRCDVGICNADNKCKGLSRGKSTAVNDFNRKDLFTQHLRRMHAPWVADGRKSAKNDAERREFEATFDEIWDRCLHEQRKPPQHSRCGFCGQEFSGPQSWDDRMEHVGSHYEKNDVLRDEEEDMALQKWSLDKGFIKHGQGQLVLTSLCS